ncbi:hypothetical protein ACS0TY_030865 [Phlomoides rotata]
MAEDVEKEINKYDNQPNQANETKDEVGPGNEMIMDYTNTFTTWDYFVSRDALLQWVRRVGNENNMVIVVKRSDNVAGKKKARVFLACEGGGSYRRWKEKTKVKRANNDDDDDEKLVKEREMGAKKCECPFLLKGTQLSPTEWGLEVKCGTHNHPITSYLEGHSYVGRLSTEEEEEFVIDMSKCNAPLKSVLKELKRKNDHNHSTLRTIYKLCKKHRVVEYCGRTQLQYLMSKLVESHYVHYSRMCSKINTLNELFFAHPVSLSLVRSFPKVLLIDCTYKTNRYWLPYLEIFGVTSTRITFCVASVYLLAEKEENYQWALGILLGDASLPYRDYYGLGEGFNECHCD